MSSSRVLHGLRHRQGDTLRHRHLRGDMHARGDVIDLRHGPWFYLEFIFLIVKKNKSIF